MKIKKIYVYSLIIAFLILIIPYYFAYYNIKKIGNDTIDLNQFLSDSKRKSLKRIILKYKDLQEYKDKESEKNEKKRIIKLYDIIATEINLENTGNIYLVIDIEKERIYIKKNRAILSEIPISFGNNDVLKEYKTTISYEFRIGIYEIMNKKRNPDWIAQEWYFKEKNILSDKYSKIVLTGFLGKYGILFIPKSLFFKQYMIISDPMEELKGFNIANGFIRMDIKYLKILFDTVKIKTTIIVK